MTKKNPNIRRFVRTFAVELLVYGVLLTAYFLLVLRYLGQPLIRLFDANLPLYGLAALGLIVAQGVVLDAVTSFLVKLVGFDYFD